MIDDHDEKLRFCNHPLVLFGGAGGFHGPIVTVKSFEDNALLRSVLEEPGEGQVLVVDGGGSTRCAVMGDKIAKLAQDNRSGGDALAGCRRIGDMPLTRVAASGTTMVIGHTGAIRPGGDRTSSSPTGTTLESVNTIGTLRATIEGGWN